MSESRVIEGDESGRQSVMMMTSGMQVPTGLSVERTFLAASTKFAGESNSTKTRTQKEAFIVCKGFLKDLVLLGPYT